MEATDWKGEAAMRKTLFHGNNRAKCVKPKNCGGVRSDDGSILGFTVFLLLCIVVAVGIMLRASYAEFMKVCADYESFVAMRDVSEGSRQDEIH